MNATEQKANNQPETSQQIAAYGGLALFGLLFDQLTKTINQRYEQRSSLLVVVGVAVTVVMRQLLPGGILFDFAAFACSGAPMVAGQFIRQHRREQRAKQHQAELR